MKKILIVENDALLQQVLLQALKPLYSCTVTQTVRDSYQQLEHQVFDAVILDRVLDDGDGVELVGYVQEFASSTRVLMISMLDSWSHKVSGLSAGADDYLAKPFALPELRIRLEHLLHSRKTLHGDDILAGNVMLHTSNGVIEVGGHSVHLRRREAQILACLMQNANKTVSKPALMKHIWIGADQPEIQTLEVYIRRLRAKLGKVSSAIVTVRGFGYRFEEPAETRDALSSPPPRG